MYRTVNNIQKQAIDSAKFFIHHTVGHCSVGTFKLELIAQNRLSTYAYQEYF